MNGNGKQEINDDDWYNPIPEGYIYNPPQPSNPNLLALVTGMLDGWRDGWTGEKVFIRKSDFIGDTILNRTHWFRVELNQYNRALVLKPIWTSVALYCDAIK